MHFSGWHLIFFFNNRKCMFLSSHEWTIWAIARQVSSYLLTFPKENNQFSLNNLDIQLLTVVLVYYSMHTLIWPLCKCAVIQFFSTKKKVEIFLIMSEKLETTYNLIFPIDILLSIFISIFFITYFWFRY